MDLEANGFGWNNQTSNANDDDDSVIELGQIAILGSSRASLKYKSTASDIAASKRSLSSRNNDNLANSKLLVNKIELDESSKDSVGANEAVAAAVADETMVEMNIPSALSFVHFKGYFYGMLSAFTFCLSQVVIRRSIWLSGPDHAFLRLLITFLIMFTVLKYKNLSVFGPSKQFNLLLFRGCLG